MATQLFKDGETVWIDPLDIQNHLQQGWSLEDPNAPKVLPAGVEIINQKAETITLPKNPELEAHAVKVLTEAYSPPKKRGPKPKSK